LCNIDDGKKEANALQLIKEHAGVFSCGSLATLFPIKSAITRDLEQTKTCQNTHTDSFFLHPRPELRGHPPFHSSRFTFFPNCPLGRFKINPCPLIFTEEPSVPKPNFKQPSPA